MGGHEKTPRRGEAEWRGADDADVIPTVPMGVFGDDVPRSAGLAENERERAAEAARAEGAALIGGGPSRSPMAPLPEPQRTLTPHASGLR